ncbi:hypothetical protein V6N13_066569 [Hibiscus sabdariffa]
MNGCNYNAVAGASLSDCLVALASLLYNSIGALVFNVAMMSNISSDLSTGPNYIEQMCISFLNLSRMKERNIEWYTYLDEYEKLVIRMTTRRVVIDNAVCPTITLVKVDGARRGGILLDVVQILVYQSLSIKKAYVSSDGQWCMHVFYATDLNGNKLTDESVISFIEHVNFT